MMVPRNSLDHYTGTSVKASVMSEAPPSLSLSTVRVIVLDVPAPVR